MKSLRILTRSLSMLAASLAALTLSCCGGGGGGGGSAGASAGAGAGAGGNDNGLVLTNILVTESGNLPGTAEANEALSYHITLSNIGDQAQTTTVTQAVPAGTRYAGEDDFSSACVVGDPASTRCELGGVSIPGNSNTMLSFRVIVDDPVTTTTIDSTVLANGIDCTTSDCIEVMPTTGISTSTGFNTVSQSDWTEASVRKVLQAFAYGGLATDAQITTWALMNPMAAIEEMLTLTYTNEKLSPAEDASGAYADSLESLQGFWGDQNEASNPMRWDKRRFYTTLKTSATGFTDNFNLGNLQRTWVQAINTRGINPFLHKVAFFLTNYHMSIKASGAGYGLFRSYYDQTVADLVNGEPFTTLIANAAKSAATARRYGHNFNIFNNSDLTISGNDDFAREFFQLFFRYYGDNESYEYHEGVNIENNAMLLTGMSVDRLTDAYGSNLPNDWFIAPILFTDHVDDLGLPHNNLSRHHADCLEIFHRIICGSTASEKIDALAAIVSVDPEVLENLPAYIINFFADDQLTPDKAAKIAMSWATSRDNLLTFLRAYAISTTFHSEDTIKFHSTFNRNLTLYNSILLNNKEAFVGQLISDSPVNEMRNQDGHVFQPTHDVFGGQTGLEASGNPNIFKSAYDAAGFYTVSRLARTNLTYDLDSTGTTQATWDKDWGGVIPKTGGQYVVGDVADWLWKRIVGDGGKNFDVIARSQVLALLARGLDFGYVVTLISPAISNNPEASYSTLELTRDEDLIAVMDGLEAETMALDDNNVTGPRRTANQRVSYAANFIAMLPYTFAMEGK